MKTILHKASSRGHSNHGWMDSYHTFSFAGYYDHDRVHFGALRVLNDDIVAGGRGFGAHPHDNMEIISIPLEGSLEHKDSMGNTHVIQKNDIQIMSAGTGIQHSEYNKNLKTAVNFLQIWVLPKLRNIKPRYDQITINAETLQNNFRLIVSPVGKDSVWINQDAYFSLGKLETGKEFSYELYKKENGIYLFVIDGDISINDNDLNRRDGLGIMETDKINFTAKSDAEVLLMEVPLSI